MRSYAWKTVAGRSPSFSPALSEIMGFTVFNVKDYGAIGDGSHDDTTNIQGAINAADSSGGGIVFFPTGTYKLTAAVTNDSGSHSVSLIGSGPTSTTLQGTVNGFLIDHNGPGFSKIWKISGLYINNLRSTTGTDITYGGLRFNYANNCIVESCQFGGHNGVVSWLNTFENTFINCYGTGPGSASWTTTGGPIGMYVMQGFICDCVFSAYYAGFLIGAQLGQSGAYDTAVIRCRAESSKIGFLLGQDQNGAGNTLTSFTLSEGTTERCDTGIYGFNVGIGSISNFSVTSNGPGPILGQGTITWSAGVATVTQGVGDNTLDNFGWTSNGTTRTVIVETLNTGTGISGFNGTFLGTRTSSTTFTYPLAGNPGANSPAGGNDWSFLPQYGLRLGTIGGLLGIRNVSIGTMQQAGIDLYNGGSASGPSNNAGVVLNGCSGGTWMMPPAGSKASFTYIACDQPGGSTTDAASNTAGMAFADLPGQSGVLIATPVEGMQYDIRNCNTSTFGATAAGGGSTHARVRWNGSNWTVMGA